MVFGRKKPGPKKVPGGKKRPPAPGQKHWGNQNMSDPLNHPRLGDYKCTREQVEKAIRVNDGRIYKTAKALGISWLTLRRYMRETWPELLEVLREVKGETIDRVEDDIFLAANRGDVGAQKYILSTQGKSRGWISEKYLRHGGDPNAPIKTEGTQKVIYVDELDLPVEINKMILAAIEAKQISNNGSHVNGDAAKTAGEQPS